MDPVPKPYAIAKLIIQRLHDASSSSEELNDRISNALSGIQSHAVQLEQAFIAAGREPEPAVRSAWEMAMVHGAMTIDLHDQFETALAEIIDEKGGEKSDKEACTEDE